jgi:hypothetical protein
MSYLRQATGSALTPKLLGTYEMEIAAIVETACEHGYDVLVDIGAAEGDYAAGMAFKQPCLRVVAFEQASAGRQLLQEMAELNRLCDRLEIRSQCTAADLQSVLATACRPLIICDVDGAEMELLDVNQVSALLSADILVELHDCFRPGISAELQRRFADSHDIEVIPTQPRHSWDCPAIPTLSKRQAYLAVQEHRPAPQAWFWMRALHCSPQPPPADPS